MASIAVLPVLIGLAVDYAIQFQARYDEDRGREGAGRAPRRRRRAPRRPGGPTIATAGLATAVGFLVLLLSPVPMVRGFGALLVLGIVLALALRAHRRASPRWCASRGRPQRPDVPPVLPARARRARDAGAARSPTSRAGAALLRALAASRDCASPSARERALAYSVAQPRRVLARRAGGGGRRAGRWTPRARSSPTSASWCRATSRRSRT